MDDGYHLKILFVFQKRVPPVNCEENPADPNEVAGYGENRTTDRENDVEHLKAMPGQENGNRCWNQHPHKQGKEDPASKENDRNTPHRLQVIPPFQISSHLTEAATQNSIAGCHGSVSRARLPRSDCTTPDHKQYLGGMAVVGAVLGETSVRVCANRTAMLTTRLRDLSENPVLLNPKSESL